MLSATWSASSRVGVNTKARTGWRAGEALVVACAIRRFRIGKEKAAVLPVPVWAAPMTSRPASTTGIAPARIGGGLEYPATATAPNTPGCRPKSAHGRAVGAEGALSVMYKKSRRATRGKHV